MAVSAQHFYGGYPRPHSHSKRNKVTHWPDPDKISVLVLLESLLHAGKTSDSERAFYIEKRRGEGVKPATIARELDLPRSTISRELRRNTDPAFNGVYSCRRADSLARERERRHKPLPKNAFHRLEPHVQDFIRQELSTHTSPEVISGRLQLEFDVFVSKNTLYRYIQQERQAGGELYQQL
ncbi:hypothetical protein EWM60_19770, partial [Candidatus Erwinia dacicola]|nr:hypothetical protein [Candidatus Erwinia dacicola]